MPDSFPLGKLPPDLLADLLARHPIDDPRVIVGPRPGEDAAVLDLGVGPYLVAKTDPITFATDEIGWYAVNVNANDIAAAGATPAWFLYVLLLPQPLATADLTEAIFEQVQQAAAALNIAVVGGHTEITYGIDRPIMSGTMLGLAERDRLVITGGAQPGDVVMVTKGVPIEATAIIAREKASTLQQQFEPQFLMRCAGYLHDPGISVVKDAAVATAAGRVHAMHDPTEGGLATGLWEMAETSGARLVVDATVALLPDAVEMCSAVGIDPLGAIASGALLMAVHPSDATAVQAALEDEGIAAFQIGHVEAGHAEVVTPEGSPLHRPARDEIAQLFE